LIDAPECVVQAFVVGVAVLDHDGADALGMRVRQTVTDRSAVALHVDGEPGQAELDGELVDDGGQVVEAVVEAFQRWLVALAVARIVGRDHAVAPGEARNQRAEHVRRGREAVQQHCRRVLRAGFAVEHLDAVDIGRVVADGAGGVGGWAIHD